MKLQVIPIKTRSNKEPDAKLFDIEWNKDKYIQFNDLGSVQPVKEAVLSCADEIIDYLASTKITTFETSKKSENNMVEIIMKSGYSQDVVYRAIRGLVREKRLKQEKKRGFYSLI